ncbi:HTH-type transcriptional regulator KdgR [Sporomusa silvacetica DSM 10669]|uniref:HTH-type transcriptional regulator KdgR n=1 Tax=Sporomusa silvacetica DSM 10669 TaxID=1123289 RepID=A0ABZ3IT85_9FIRM|nr:LacI family DNA-binding transcriptional regulator [Sporomusa silvacetica]OZC19756.1 HTH-type transcriptional regulator KdgR [Sporomusa silvacetica DSM 10669]
MSVTIAEVARIAGVSKSTVSRYLNGFYDHMGADTKERIAQVIAELDYRPNALARSLKQKRTHTVGAIVANILNPFSTSIIRGIEDTLQEAGFNLILCNADDDPAKERDYVNMLVDKQIDGLIINTTGCNNELIAQVNQTIPIVLIDRKASDIDIDTVTVDSARGVRQAVDHMVSLGHAGIAMLTLPYDHVSPRLERVQAYQTALAAHGIPFREDWLVQTSIEEDAILSKLQALLGGEAIADKPTSIFCANNMITMSVVKAIKQMGLTIPDEIAVLGFDDWEWAQLIDPPVTVVAQPVYDMGNKAAALLIKRMKGGRSPKKPITILFEPQLLKRKSCGE